MFLERSQKHRAAVTSLELCAPFWLTSKKNFFLIILLYYWKDGVKGATARIIKQKCRILQNFLQSTIPKKKKKM